MKSLSKLTLLTALLCGGANAAWADTTIGSLANGWDVAESKSPAYTIPANKTLTLTFTVTDYDYVEGTKDFPGYVLNLTRTNATQFGGTAFTWLRSADMCFYATNWWQGALHDSNTFGEVDKKAFIKGATTVMAIKRFGTQVYIDTKITKDATSYYHYYVQELGTSEDIYAFLCADFATITISDDAVTETSTVGSVNPMFGAEDNSGGFAASHVGILAPNQVMNMHFTNYTSGANTWNTWGIELIYNDGENQYFDLVAGNLNRWGTLYCIADPWSQTAKTAEFANVNWPATDDALKAAMAGADVSLTIARNGRVVTITAVHTPVSGDPFVLKHTLEPKDDFTGFATGNLTVKLLSDGSHATCNYPVKKVNAEVSKYGWSTFCSDYKLDFTGISSLEAYAVTGNDASVVTTSDALGVVKAGDGVLLKGTAGGASTYYNIPVSTGAAYSGDNLLVAGSGDAVGYAAGYTRYVLGVKNDKAVFQRLSDGGSSATVAKGQAYLQFTGALSAPALFFNFNGGTTGIDATLVNSEKRIENSVYDLQGRQIVNGKLQRGLYILNGKKVIIK